MLNKVENAELALTVALDLADNHTTVTEYHLLVSDLYADRGEKDKAIEWAEKARTASLTSNSYPERVMVADTYFGLGLYRQASLLYQELITSYEDSRNLRRLLSSYMSGDFRSEALDLFSRLPEHVKELRFYGRACAELFYRLGDLPKARKHLEKCIKIAPQDLELILNYITLLERMGKNNDINDLLNNLHEFEDVYPEDFIKLSHTYARFGKQEKALQVGYEALQRFGSVAAVHLGYCGLLLVALKDIPQIDRVRDDQKIDVNTAFTCLTQSGKKRTFVIEPNPIKDVEGEITPDNVIARKTIGLKVNDKFVILENPFGKEEATIVEVKHKYLHALHETMENFQYRFPDVPGMWMVGLNMGAEGDLDLQPILDAVTQRSDAVLRTEELYATHPLPLALVAHHIGVHPIDCLLGISSGGRVKIKCCIGDFAERLKVAKAVLASKAGFIIDPFSLYTLFTLNVLDDILKITKGNLGITQTTLDLFTELIKGRDTSQPHLTLSKKDGQFFREEISEENIKLSIVPFEKIIAWCRENCEIVAAKGKPGIDEEGKSIFSGLHPVFLDTLLAASGTGRILISEDLHYRQVGKLLFEVGGVWTQPLLQLGMQQNLISALKYHEAITQLINMNYGFISISAEDLIYQLVKQGYDLTGNFEKMISTISNGNADLPLSIIVIADFIRILLQKPISRWRLDKVIYAVLNSLTSNPTFNQNKIIGMLWLLLVRKMALEGSITETNLQLSKIVINSWCTGHFVSGIP